MKAALERLRQHRLALEQQNLAGGPAKASTGTNDFSKSVYRKDIERLYQKIKPLLDCEESGEQPNTETLRNICWQDDLGVYFTSIYQATLKNIDDRATSLETMLDLKINLRNEFPLRILSYCADIANECFLLEFLCLYFKHSPPKDMPAAVDQTLAFFAHALASVKRLDVITASIPIDSRNRALINDISRFSGEAKVFHRKLKQRLLPAELAVGKFPEQTYDALRVKLPAILEVYLSKLPILKRWFMTHPGQPLCLESVERFQQLADFDAEPLVFLGMIIQHYSESQDVEFYHHVNLWLRVSGLPEKEELPAKLKDLAVTALKDHYDSQIPEATQQLYCLRFCLPRPMREGYEQLSDSSNMIPLLNLRR